MSVDLARMAALKAKVVRQQSQIRWLRDSRDNWKLKAKTRLAHLRKRAA